MYNTIFVVICFILDLVVQHFIPIDTSYLHFVVISSFSFMSLFMLFKRLNMFKLIVCALIIGLFQDFLSGEVLIYGTINLICCFIYYNWNNSLSDSLFEKVLLLLSMVLIKEFLIFGYYSILGVTNITLMNFLYSRCFLTLGLALIESFIIIVIDSVFENKINYINERNQKKDTLFGHQFK